MTINLDELERLEKSATPPPWRSIGHEGGSYPVVPQNEGDTVCFVPDDTNRRPKSNAALIAAARNALPALIRIARAAKEYRELSGSVVDNRKWWAAKLELDEALKAVSE